LIYIHEDRHEWSLPATANGRPGKDDGPRSNTSGPLRVREAAVRRGLARIAAVDKANSAPALCPRDSSSIGARCHLRPDAASTTKRSVIARSYSKQLLR